MCRRKQKIKKTRKEKEREKRVILTFLLPLLRSKKNRKIKERRKYTLYLNVIKKRLQKNAYNLNL